MHAWLLLCCAVAACQEQVDGAEAGGEIGANYAEQTPEIVAVDNSELLIGYASLDDTPARPTVTIIRQVNVPVGAVKIREAAERWIPANGFCITQAVTMRGTLAILFEREGTESYTGKLLAFYDADARQTVIQVSHDLEPANFTAPTMLLELLVLLGQPAAADAIQVRYR